MDPAPPSETRPEIRRVQEADAAGFLALMQALDRETRFMMLEPGERSPSVEHQRQRIAGLLQQENSTLLVAEAGGQLVGFVSAEGGTYQRNRHSAYLVAGVRQDWAGQGLGTHLFAAVIDWARQHGLHRLELTVMAHNPAGIALYRKMGFESEGLRRHSLRVDGRWVDEVAMALLL